MTSPNPPIRRRPPAYRPTALLGILYFAVIFFVIGLLLVMPELMKVLETVPPGPEQQELANRVAHEAIRPRMPIALVLAVGVTALGGYFGILPGLKPR